MAAYVVRAPDALVAWFNARAAELWERHLPSAKPKSVSAGHINFMGQMAHTWHVAERR